MIQGFGVQTASLRDSKPEKGQMEELQVLAGCLGQRDAGWPIPLEKMIETTEVTLKLAY